MKIDLDLECAGEQLRLLPEKAVFWPRKKTLIVADLHFGKPAAFRQSGIPVPESTTAYDLDRLDLALDRTDSTSLIILGDFFHSAAGLQPEMMEVVENWRNRQRRLTIILFPGNHDQHAGLPPPSWDVQNGSDIREQGPFFFCHEPRDVLQHYVLSGHVHPAVLLREKFGPSLRAPCFCFGPRRAILPAFGSFTGMHDIRPAKGERIFAIGDSEVLELPFRNS